MRVLTAVAAAGLSLTLAGGALAAWVPAQAAASSPRPLPGEWWFAAWSIQARVWPLTRGAGVTVAVLDSGVQANVPDLRGAVVPGADMTGAGTNGMTDDDFAKDGHGTAMAALIAGQGRGTGLVGIAPAAKIMPVRVGGKNGVPQGGTSETIAAGIRYAVQHGAQVINLSVAGISLSASGCETNEQDAVAYALQHNVVVVAAAGDRGHSGNPPMQPASCAGVLAVGAVNPNLTAWPEGERQPYVAVSAPGNHVGWSGRDGRYFPDGFGTSQAAAFTSGEAALVRSRYPAMPWQRVVQRIIRTSLRRGHPVRGGSLGYGIIRIAGAVDAARYPVRAGLANPVYDAFRRWLASPQGRLYLSLHPKRPGTAVPSPTAAGPSSPGVPRALVVLLGAVLVLAAAAAAVVAVSRRRRARW